MDKAASARRQLGWDAGVGEFRPPRRPCGLELAWVVIHEDRDHVAGLQAQRPTRRLARRLNLESAKMNGIAVRVLVVTLGLTCLWACQERSPQPDALVGAWRSQHSGRVPANQITLAATRAGYITRWKTGFRRRNGARKRCQDGVLSFIGVGPPADMRSVCRGRGDGRVRRQIEQDVSGKVDC